MCCCMVVLAIEHRTLGLDNDGATEPRVLKVILSSVILSVISCVILPDIDNKLPVVILPFILIFYFWRLVSGVHTVHFELIYIDKW